MLGRTKVLMPILLLATVSYGCTSDESVVNVPATTDLITNSSFEFNGASSLQGWVMFLSPPLDTMRDAPPGGGTWSIAIRGVNFLPVPSVRFTAAAPIGMHVYQFSTWAKDVISGGLAELRLKGTDTTYVLRSLAISDTGWAWYSTLDTLGTIAGDSLQVTLRGAAPAGIAAKTFFDLCKLDVMN